MIDPLDTTRYNAENDAAPEIRSRYTRAEIDAAWDRVAMGPNPDCAGGPNRCQRQWAPDGACWGCAGLTEVQL